MMKLKDNLFITSINLVRESGNNQSFYNIVLVEENSWTQQNTPRKKSLSKIQKVSLCKLVHKLTLEES